MAQVAGSVISAVKDACRNGLLDWSPRLKLAMYTCDIQASSTYDAMDTTPGSNHSNLQPMCWERFTQLWQSVEGESSPRI
jgi:hypothetical protein